MLQKIKNMPLPLLLLVFFISTCSGQNTILIPKEFKGTIPPKAESKEWYKLNYSKNDFEVKITNNKLQIKKNTKERECKLKTTSGTFFGKDLGEWGGQLTFVSNDSTPKTIKIKDGNIKFIFQFKNKIYFFEGLAHMDINKGALYKLDASKNSFSYEKIIDFDDAPQAFTIFKNKLLIASYQNFYLVKDFKKQVILKNTFWGGLYPNSIAVFNERNVFIGIRSGIVKLDLTTKTLKFYKKI